MIRHLHHHQIDTKAWDRQLQASANASWYGTSTALNAAAPGWNALVDEEGGAQMPLPWRRKFGITYLHQPFLIQHLGPYAPKASAGLAEGFIKALPGQYRYADINLDGREVPELDGLRTEPRRNHVLALGAGAEAIHAGYSTNHRRSLRKAGQHGLLVEKAQESGRIAAFLEASEQFTRWKVDARQREAMRRVFRATEADGSGFGRMATEKGAPVAAGWFVVYGDRIIFLKGLASQRGRETGAMHALLHQVITEFAARHAVFDLAGGNDPQLARFYSGFGAEPVFYLRALMNRLPPVIRRIKP